LLNYTCTDIITDIKLPSGSLVPPSVPML